MVGWENPFTTLATPPAEGVGLNPLLRHPAMMIHPPMLYTGYVGFSIPFAFAVGALITRSTGADWIRATRRFALVAWTFLGVGIMLGALWSYTELGWGGYWAWDPVENASLLPWLTGTAFLHSVMVQEKRGMLKVWNVSLIMATFVLALLGTFLVRSGILESIHAFGASTIGTQFLTFIGIVIVGSVALVVWRLPDLRSTSRLDSLISREAFFLLNNLVLVALALVVFWGTFFPLISEAVTGTEASVGPPVVQPRRHAAGACAGGAHDDRADAGLAPGDPRGPVARRARAGGVRRHRRRGGGALATNAADSLPALAMFGLVAVLLAVVVQEFARGAAGPPRAHGRGPARPRSASLSAATGADTAATSCTPGSPSCSSGWPARRRSTSRRTCGSRPARASPRATTA